MLLQKLIGGLLVLTVTSLAAAECPKQDEVKKGLERISGTWKVTAIEADGEQAPREVVAALKIVFEEDTLTFKPGEPGFTKFKIKLDPASKPPRLDMIHAEGLKKGETLKGVYLLKDDRMKIFFGLGDHRPTELTAKADSGQLMYSLRREKP